MPFTTAHPAIVLPLKQWFPRWFSLTGLMAGAMSPDLVYFLTLRTEFRGLSHSWTGVLLTCLPLGILFSFAFHWLFKYPFMRHLPSPLDRSLAGLAQSPWRITGLRQWTVFLISLLVGTLSHFFWDAFTHPNGAIASIWPALQQKVMLLGQPRLVCRILQHVSSLVGTIVILLYAIKGNIIPRAQVVENKLTARSKVWFSLGGAIVASAFAIAAATAFASLSGWNLETGYGRFLSAQTLGLAGWAGFFYWTVIFGLVKRQSRYQPAKPTE